MPLLPRLAPWYRLVEDGDRLLFEHGRSVVVLEGGAVRALFPRLLPLLDGSRTLEQIVDRIGAQAAEAIGHVVKDDELNPNFIIPSVFNPDVPKAVAAAIRGADA